MKICVSFDQLSQNYFWREGDAPAEDENVVEVSASVLALLNHAKEVKELEQSFLEDAYDQRF